jgi:hypothetical protein
MCYDVTDNSNFFLVFLWYELFAFTYMGKGFLISSLFETTLASIVLVIVLENFENSVYLVAMS